jgi:DNA polymerase-1
MNTKRETPATPHIQNIPIRTEAGRKIKEAFLRKNGNVLISTDYSALERRLQKD